MSALRTFTDSAAAWRAREDARAAVVLLRDARARLRAAGADRAAARVGRAIASGEGAVRHLERVYMARYHDERHIEEDHDREVIVRQALPAAHPDGGGTA